MLREGTTLATAAAFPSHAPPSSPGGPEQAQQVALLLQPPGPAHLDWRLSTVQPARAEQLMQAAAAAGDWGKALQLVAGGAQDSDVVYRYGIIHFVLDYERGVLVGGKNVVYREHQR